MEYKKSRIPTPVSADGDNMTTWALPDGTVGRLGRGIINDITVAPNKKSLAIGTRVGVWMYELDTMQPVTLFETERGMISNVVLSNDGQWVVSNGDGIIKVRETETQKCVAKIQGWHRGTSQLAISDDDQYIAASGYEYGDVYVWSTETGMHVASFKMIRKPKKDENIPYRYPLCFSPNGQLLAYAPSWFSLTVRHLKTKDRFAHIIPDRKLPRTGYISDLAFSPCSQYLAASIHDLTTKKNIEVQIWNIESEYLEAFYTDFDGNRVIPAFSPNGTLHVADVYENKVVMWDASCAQKLDSFEYQGTRHAVCLSSDGQLCAIVTEHEIDVWCANTTTTVAPFSEPTNVPDSLFFTQSDKTLVSKYWGGEGTVAFWDISKKQVMPPPIPTKSRGKRCALSPCNDLLAFVGEKKHTLEIWNITSGNKVTELNGHQNSILTIVFSPSGEHLISGDTGGKIIVWSVQRWEKQHTFIGHDKAIRTAVFHPNGQQYATAARNGPIYLWDVISGQQLGSPSLNFTLEDASLYKGDSRVIQQRYKQKSKMRWLYSVKFSPCGTLLAGGIWGEIRLWDAATLEPRMGMILPESCFRVGVVAFSPCGRYLASGSWWYKTDKVSIRLWEVATGENIHTFWGHTSDVQNLAFSVDGKLLASSSYDGTILLWDMKPFINS